MKTKLLFLSVALTIATSVLAGMPTDINKYTQEGIVKISSNTGNLSINISYLAYTWDSYTSYQYYEVFLRSPSGKSYIIGASSPSSWFFKNSSSFVYNHYVLNGAYVFFDLQAVEPGTWKLTLVQSYAGDWYYYYDASLPTPVKKGSAIISQDCSKNGKSINLANPANGHDYVDLGLSVLWATCNVGATTPEDYGDYFAWGETTPKSSYTWSNYKYCNGSSSSITKYNSQDGKMALEPEDDAAFVNWGGAWRLPTRQEEQELLNQCHWEWNTYQGVNGYSIQSSNGESIFLPAAGCFNVSLNSGSSHGYYPSSELENNQRNEYLIWFDSSNTLDYDPYESKRAVGRTVRAVLPKSAAQSTDKADYTLTLFVNGCSTSNTYACAAGQEVQIYAEPSSDDYIFLHWNDGSTENPRSLVVTQNTTLEAQFAIINTYTITTTVDDPAHGTTQGDTMAPYLDTITISATPNYGYHFVQWKDSIKNYHPQITIRVKKPYNWSAIYMWTWETGKEGHWEEMINQEDDWYIYYTKEKEINFLFSNKKAWGGFQTVDLYTDTDVCMLIEEQGFGGLSNIVEIDCGNNIVSSEFTNPRQVVVKGDATYTAQFDKNQYVVTINKGEHIQSVVGAGTHKYLDKISLSVTAETHYRFDHWADGNTDNPRVLVVTQDTLLTAISAKIYTGKCGDNLMWNYNDGVLVISGTGDMYDYTQGTSPWILFKDSINSLVINNGCTSIGNFAFYGLSNKDFKTIDLPNGIEQIGQYAFANCEYLKNLYLGLALEKISANAFANDERLLYITCYAIEPPLLDESAFVNYDAYLSVPCESQDEYKVAKGWKKFNKENISCIGAEEKPVATDEVTVVPTDNQATFTWPQNDQAAGYSIEITKDGVVFCTLKFNAQGQLTGIAFAPSRDGAREMAAAEMTANGWQFTVTGLNQSSKYGYTLDATNANQQSIKHYEGEFTTTGATGLEWLTVDNAQCTIRKMIIDNQLFIFRGNKIYNAAGVLVK